MELIWKSVTEKYLGVGGDGGGLGPGGLACRGCGPAHLAWEVEEVVGLIDEEELKC